MELESGGISRFDGCAETIEEHISMTRVQKQAIRPGTHLLPDALLNMAKLNYEEENYLTARAFLQRYEAAASHNAESLLLGYRIESASRDSKTADKYKRMLELNFPDSSQTAEVRRIPGK